MGEEKHAHALLSPAFRGRQRLLGFTFKLWTEELRRAEREDTTEAIGIGADAAPFVGGRERYFVEHRVLFTRNGISQRFAGLRPGRRAAGEDAQHRPYLPLLGIVYWLHIRQPHPVRGEGAGLVHAEDVDVGEGL